MNFEALQKTWQSGAHGRGMAINADGLLPEVRRRQRQFRRIIFWRDVREVGVAWLLVPLFIYCGRHLHNGMYYLVALACLLVGAFIMADRWRQKKTTPDVHDSLKNCATTSLAEVSHQIWLLENVLWWYLLPLAVPLLVLVGWSDFRSPAPVVQKWSDFLVSVGIIGLMDWGIYWLNQSAVKKVLEPRRQELAKLLDGLEPPLPTALMKTTQPLGLLLAMLALSAVAVTLSAALPSKNSPDHPDQGIEAIGRRHHLPALAVVVAKNGKICDRAAAGVRKWGESVPVTTNDVFHIGSCTKSMTATLAAMFIEQGKLRWDTTIAEVFPELKGRMNKQYETVTLEQLLHHRGGVPSSPPPAAWQQAWREIGTPVQQRREYLEAVLSRPPAAVPGTRMLYSNDGYVIVGVMLEKISGQDFETLMTERLFKPLHMDTAGFGAPGTKGQLDQPWGHSRRLLVTLPVQMDNPPVHSPCGRVHCSLDDLARYAMFHLQRGTNGLLKPETMARLHALPEGAVSTDETENYACGWVVTQRPWAGGKTLYHNGSNTFFYLVMWLAPEKDFCVIAAANIYNDDAEAACDEAAGAMIHKWLPE